MREGRASRTAQHNALFRALEQRLPQPLFHDPWARRFLRGRYRLVSLLPAAAVARAIDRRFPGPRAAVAVRTRYFDDALEAALAAGVEQVVILGAGFDSRAHRLAAMRRVPVFEVDHPATQAMKRRVVGRGRSSTVRYVPVRFGTGGASRTGALGTALAGAGFAASARTVFLWEGVTNYLDEPTVDVTLRFIAASAELLLFTYIDRAILDDASGFEGAAESIAHVQRLGEPFTWGLRPAEAAGYLAERGLELLEDQPLSSLARRWYGEGGPKVSTYYHVARARCRG